MRWFFYCLDSEFKGTVTFLTSYAHFFITCKPTHRAFCYDERTLRKKTYKTAIVKLLDTIGWLKIQLILI